MFPCPNCGTLITKESEAHLSPHDCIAHLKETISGFEHSLQWKQNADETIKMLQDELDQKNKLIHQLKQDTINLRERINKG